MKNGAGSAWRGCVSLCVCVGVIVTLGVCVWVCDCVKSAVGAHVGYKQSFTATLKQRIPYFENLFEIFQKSENKKEFTKSTSEHPTFKFKFIA